MWKWEAEGQPKAVVAIFHGAYEHYAWYAWLIEKLRSTGFHVVMGDLPGHGVQTKNHRYHDEDFSEYYTYAKQLVEVAQTDNLPVFIIGNGLGATIAARAVYRNKVECAGLIMVSPWLQLKLEPGKLSKALSSLSAITSSVKLTHDITHNQLTRNFEVYGEMKDEIPFNTVVTVKWYRELQQLLKMLKDPEVKISSIPLLVMTGGRDKITDTTASRQWLVQQNSKSFQFKEWPECLSSLFFEFEREEVFLLTKDFMHNSLRSLGYIID
ncbi:alpha/beta hydrolase [Lysinibacillus sp. KU-BSD001]|uniref:alpha/beta fold hydrolase n=1 Tax=Lysinibacillus sp. KU-BSD001 TaxID=3141328 RepID=UPI0036E921F6